ALHFLRHLREPEALDGAELDALWTDIAAASAPEKRAFWRTSWFRWLAPVGAAAGIAFVLVQGGSDGAPSLARNDSDAEPAASAPAAIEAKLAQDSERTNASAPMVAGEAAVAAGPAA